VAQSSGPFWGGYPLEYVRVPPQGVLQRVSVPHHRIVLAIAGTCDICCRVRGDERRHRLAPGAFCFAAQGFEFDRLTWHSSAFEAVMLDILDLSSDPNPIDEFGRTDALFDMYIGLEDARVTALIGMMREEIEAGCPTGSAHAAALSLALGSRVASLCTALPRTQRRAGVLTTRQLNRVTDFIARNLSQPLTIDRLASLASTSVFHFARCFKCTTGMTPHQYVTRARIAKARELLVEGRCTVAEIATTLGFSSQSHFAEVYRRVTGIAPSRDRSADAGEQLRR
jgi:AraC family transcriptional regulator